MNGKKKIALVLSGGGMHGFAQLGALRVLEKHGIKPDLIVGCSVGSLIGAAMAAGKKVSEIEEAVLKTNMMQLIQPTIGQGLVRGEKIALFILKTIKIDKFEDLKTRLIVNATNITKQKEEIFESGNMLKPLTASISIPGVFAPVELNGELFVDGGFYDIAPLHLASKMDIIIIIDVSKIDNAIKPKSGILDITAQSIAILQQRAKMLNFDNHAKTHKLIFITPDVSKYGLFEYRKTLHHEMLKIGEDTANRTLSDPKIRKLLNLK